MTTSMVQNGAGEGNSSPINGDVPTETVALAQDDQAALLAKLHMANQLLEADSKSLKSLSSNAHSSGHSRKSSDTSIISSNSLNSNISNLQYDDETSPEELWELWGKLVNDWDNVKKKKPLYIRDMVRKGVPHHFRGIVWQLLCDAHKSKVKDKYTEYLKKSSPYEKVIRRDIARTYPEHDFFKEKNGLGQESLFNVMKAYSNHDREVGYCQGSGFIVGLLLMQMPEEEAFTVLTQLMSEYRLRELYKPTMAELGLLLYQLECMLQEHLPDLYVHFQMQNLCVSMFASSWFLTLFSTSLQLPVACRIFDVFLAEGMESIFRESITILQQFQEELMSKDMEGMLKIFQKVLPTRYEAEPDTLMMPSYNVKYNPKKMKKLEKDYNTLKSKEQEDQVELRRLRTENRLLRQRIENLEKETGTLADRLIQDQVVRAQTEEEVFILRRDVATLRTQNKELNQKLETCDEELCSMKERASVVSSNAVYQMQTSQEESELRVSKIQAQMNELLKRERKTQAENAELREKMKELESTNRRLQDEPGAEIQQLQEELIACKLREAEATLSMKELRQRVTEVEKCWQKHQELATTPTEEKKTNKDMMKAIQEEVMNVRLREAQSLAELQELKQKVMELETQNQILARQIKRMGEENQKLKDQIESEGDKEKELEKRLRDFENAQSDLESKRKEESMMSRIKDAEYAQTLAEMRQRIAELEIENQELITAGQLTERNETQDLENQITDLQEEVLQLKMAKRLASISSMSPAAMLNHATIGSDTDSYESDGDDKTIMEHHKLKLTDSYGPLELRRLTQAPPNDLDDSSDNEGLHDYEEGVHTVKRKLSKKSSAGNQKLSAVEDHVKNSVPLIDGSRVNETLANQSSGHKCIESTLQCPKTVIDSAARETSVISGDKLLSQTPDVTLGTDDHMQSNHHNSAQTPLNGTVCDGQADSIS